MPSRKKLLLRCVYFLVTVQFAGCYFWLTRPYVSTHLYELGRERMPFQGRMLMTLPKRLAYPSFMLHLLAKRFARPHFWFPRPAQPEVLMQAAINVVSLMSAGWFTIKIYRASSPRQLLLHWRHHQPRDHAAAASTLPDRSGSAGGRITLGTGNRVRRFDAGTPAGGVLDRLAGVCGVVLDRPDLVCLHDGVRNPH